MPKQPEFPADELVGQTLSQTLSAIPRIEELPSELHEPRGRGPLLLLVALLFGVILVLGIALVGGAGAGVWLFWRAPTPDPGPVAIEVPDDDGAATVDDDLPDDPPPVDLAPDDGTDVPEDEGMDGTDDLEAPDPGTETPEVAPTAPEPVPPRPVVPDPAPPPAAAVGTVTLAGDASRVELRGTGGTTPPGQVTAGTWEVWASFGGDLIPAGSVTVPEGGTVDLRCSARFKRCMAQ